MEIYVIDKNGQIGRIFSTEETCFAPSTAPLEIWRGLVLLHMRGGEVILAWQIKEAGERYPEADRSKMSEARRELEDAASLD